MTQTVANQIDAIGIVNRMSDEEIASAAISTQLCDSICMRHSNGDMRPLMTVLSVRDLCMERLGW